MSATSATPSPARELVALIPAGGLATRISPLPCSKEILPVGLSRNPGDGTLRPKVVSQYLIEKMRLAGTRRGYFILRKGKWDIPEFFGDGAALGLSLGYLIMGVPHGPPYTLDQAHPFVREATVLFGFPDILFTPDDAFTQALARLGETNAAVVLGLFPAQQPDALDMAGTDAAGRVTRFEIKPRQTDLKWAWMFAVWTPRFTEFLHEFLEARERGLDRSGSAPIPELSVGHVMQAAMKAGLPVDSVAFPKDRYLDIGTPDGLRQATRESLEQ